MHKSNIYNQTVGLSQQTWAKLHLQTDFYTLGSRAERFTQLKLHPLLFFALQKSNTNSAINRFSLNSSAAAPHRAPNITGHKKWKAAGEASIGGVHSQLAVELGSDCGVTVTPTGRRQEWRAPTLLCLYVRVYRGWSRFLQSVYAYINAHIAYVCLNTTIVVYLIRICLNIVKYVCLHMRAFGLI